MKNRIIAISQVYWPDTASVSQHLTDLLEALAVRGYDVKVISSQFNYENSQMKYSHVDFHHGVEIIRLRNTGFGKSRILFRLLDFLSFNILLIFRLLRHSQKGDVVIGLTSPPLVSYIGVIISKIKRMKFIYWTMDLQPELSISAGYLKKGSISAFLLQNIGNYIFKKSDSIIALDKYMREYVEKRGGNANYISTVPVWPVMQSVYSGSRAANPFRLDNGFGDKIVIMYSGNHSVVHPLDTLLNTAKSLRSDGRFLFVHIGAGVRLNDVLQFKKENNLSNIVTLPYQPREKIHFSLGSADIQVVILGEGCVGYTHPNKIYGAMFIGKPILYIGPEKSHISDCIKKIEGNISVRHGESEKLSTALIEFAKEDDLAKSKIGENNKKYAETHLHPPKLIQDMVNCIKKS